MRIAGLELFGRIDRYIAGLFVGAYFTSLLLVVGLAVIIDVASNLDYFTPWESGESAPTSLILRYYALNAPFLYLQVAPFVTVSAALFSVVKLSRHNELVACLNAGVSARRAVVPLFLGGALAALGMVALRELATERLGPERDRLRHLLDTHTAGWQLEDVWMRDVAGNVVGARAFHPDEGRIEGLEIVGAPRADADLGFGATRPFRPARGSARVGARGWSPAGRNGRYVHAQRRRLVRSGRVHLRPSCCSPTRATDGRSSCRWRSWTCWLPAIRTTFSTRRCTTTT